MTPVVVKSSQQLLNLGLVINVHFARTKHVDLLCVGLELFRSRHSRGRLFEYKDRPWTPIEDGERNRSC